MEINETLQTFAKENKYLGGGHLAFVAVVGSQNYGTAIPGSDIDLKAAYFPRWDNFYDGSFPTKCSKEGFKDVNIHPIHTMVKYILKGNMNFFEVLYTPYIVTPEYSGIPEIFDKLRVLVPMQSARIGMATYGMIHEAKKEWDKSCAMHMDGPDKKIAANIFRLAYFLKDYADTGSIRLKDYSSTPTALNIRRGIISTLDINHLLPFVIQGAKERAEYLRSKDKEDSEEFQNLKMGLDVRLCALCWDKVEEIG